MNTSFKRKPRLRQILDWLQSDSELTVDEACRRLNASPATVRRDFVWLVQEGHAEKTWGGLKLPGALIQRLGPPAFTTRLDQNAEGKKAIARAAAELLVDGDVVMIDGGTTTFQLTEFIAHRRIRIITNSLVIAQAVDRAKAGRVGAEIYLTGGGLPPESGVLVGPQAEAFLQRYRAQWAFLSAAGVDAEAATNYDEAVLGSERIMIEQSARVALLVDHTKIGLQAMCQLCPIGDVDCLVTDKWSENAKLLRQISRAGVQLIEV
jgi:DeoR/GlpR family transcriptional regulator of sugar metabolism